ncbi:hypothetical protein K1719_016010 [Acacia pycnantha]|nr:hypothetical protein K1719_016010 [Acacia pycnantha]
MSETISSTSNPSSSLISPFVPITLSPFMKRTLSNKIENLIEITHHLDLPSGNTELPLLNPYSHYHRTNTFTSSIISLIRTRRPDVKEVVQSTILEQYLIDQWKSQGYTHLHFGAIRLVLTLHGRKGIPVTAKVALLDSTYKKYSDTLIGALLTTLSNGSVILTIQLDYNVSLFDKTLPGCLKIPRQIPKEELAQIMPMEWISNYEKLFHSIQTDVHITTPPTTQDLGNGVTKNIFSRPSVSGPRPSDRILMLTPAYSPSRKSPPIAWVNQDAKPCYVSHNGGKIVLMMNRDFYACKYAFEKVKKNKSSQRSSFKSQKSKKFDDDDDYSSSQPVSSRRSTRRWRPPPPPKKSSKEMSLVELMMETGHHDLVQKYFPDAIPSTPLEPYTQSQTALPQPIPCIAILTSYDQDFPPLERKYDQNTRVSSKPYVIPSTVDAQGNYQATQAEEVLNWQTQNVVCQNTILKRIDSKIDSLTTKTDGLTYYIDQLSEEVKNLYLHQRQQANKLDAELKDFIERGLIGQNFIAYKLCKCTGRIK